MRKIWNIKKIKVVLGLEICVYIFFVYVILGCDIMLGIYGIGKGLVFKKIMKDV